MKGGDDKATQLALNIGHVVPYCWCLSTFSEHLFC